jgi:RHS repeat-associated protein
MLLPNRHESSNEYRYGFNGMEKDDEVSGEGNSYDFGARLYNPRVGRWLSIDPFASKYADISPYVFVANNPIIFIDPDGKDVKPSEAFKKTNYVYCVFNVIKSQDVFIKINNAIAIDYMINYVEIADPIKKNGVDYYQFPRASTTNGKVIDINLITYADNTASSPSFNETALVKTIIHEMWHAKLFDLYKKYTIKVDGDTYLTDDASEKAPGFSDMIEKYGSAWQHEYMAIAARPDLLKAMKDYDKSQGITPELDVSYTEDEYYEALSWGGLRGTETYENSVSEENKKLYDLIIDENQEDLKAMPKQYYDMGKESESIKTNKE